MSLFDEIGKIGPGHKSTHYSKSQQAQKLAQEAYDTEFAKNNTTDQGDIYSDIGNIGSNYDKYVGMTGAGQLGSHPLDNMSPDEKQRYARQALSTMANTWEQTQKVNDIADKTRLGGKYTDSGLLDASNNAMANGRDRIKAKGLIGLGGSQVPGTMTFDPYGPSQR